MALNYNEINSITQSVFLPKLVDNIFSSNVLFQRSRKKWYTTRSGGTKVIQPVAYALATAAGWYNGQDSLSTTANDQITALEFDWMQAYANITITGRDEKINSGKEAIVDFVKSKVQLAEKTLVDILGTGLYNAGTTTNAIIGLRLAVDSAGTYGGVSRTDYSWLAAQEDSTSTALSLPLMQGIYGDCTVGNSHPTVIATTQDIFDTYWNKLQTQQRFQDSDTAKAGFSNLLFNGTPVVVDGHCPASHMFFLNEDYLQFIVQSDRNFSFEPFIRTNAQDISTAKIYWMGALVCSNPRMQGKFGALTA